LSSSSYIAYHFDVEPLQPASDILIAELGEVGFESFVELDEGLTAYVQKSNWNAFILEDIQILKSEAFRIHYTFEEIKQTNWNAEWEKNFEPIVVDGRVTIRAPFHDRPKTEYDILIEPKMSFGTGHHETTHMMIQHILHNNFKDQSVLDMGCGTGVLAIMAELVGAKPIDAIDIDNWSYLNSIENTERNNCKYVSVYEGSSTLLKDRSYDRILANINRNILLKDLPVYARCLKKEGSLFLSGFYEDDVKIIEDQCMAHGLSVVNKLKRNEWVSLHLKINKI
jgi:ribosomal protein L11 methyltransferase